MTLLTLREGTPLKNGFFAPNFCCKIMRPNSRKFSVLTFEKRELICIAKKIQFVAQREHSLFRLKNQYCIKKKSLFIVIIIRQTV
jgi:hypothetical protein